MIEIILGTNRPESNTAIVARTILRIHQDLGGGAALLDLGTLPQSLFLPASYAAKPSEFTPFTERVLASDGLVVVTPEYNGSFPGVLKYFIDMLPFPESFERRPVCFVGLAAGNFGALRPVEQLQMIFSHRNAHIFPQRVFLPTVNDLIGGDGNIECKDILDRLRKQAEGFRAFVSALPSAH